MDAETLREIIKQGPLAAVVIVIAVALGVPMVNAMRELTKTVREIFAEFKSEYKTRGEHCDSVVERLHRIADRLEKGK